MEEKRNGVLKPSKLFMPPLVRRYMLYWLSQPICCNYLGLGMFPSVLLWLYPCSLVWLSVRS